MEGLFGLSCCMFFVLVVYCIFERLIVSEIGSILILFSSDERWYGGFLIFFIELPANFHPWFSKGQSNSTKIFGNSTKIFGTRWSSGANPGRFIGNSKSVGYFGTVLQKRTKQNVDGILLCLHFVSSLHICFLSKLVIRVVIFVIRNLLSSFFTVERVRERRLTTNLWSMAVHNSEYWLIVRNETKWNHFQNKTAKSRQLKSKICF